ncbi:MAG: zinc ABC transporter substrate-binding protein [Candidatus Omnitrophota bacterium]
MKMIRRCFLVTLFVVLPLNCGWCEGRTKILASFYPMYIMALNVARDVPGVTVMNLTSPSTGCLHDYALTVNDMKKIVDADILVVNGAGMESFLERVTARYPELKIAKLSEGIPLIKGGEEDGDNPHVWVSISNAITQVKNLCNALRAFDPSRGDAYQKNTDEYVSRLEFLRQRMHIALDRYRGRKIVTFHEAFPYFAREFGLEIAAVVEREPGSEPSARELAKTIDLVREAGIKALFAEPQYPVIVAKSIAEETGAKVYILDPAVTGPEQPDAYIKIMEMNLETLKGALKN